MSEAIITTYSEDDVILKQGDPSRCLYKVLSGSVGLFLNYGQEEEYLVGAVSAPNCFGEMTILAARPNPYTVVALKKDTVLLRVPESNFDVFIQENYQNAIMIMKTMARNLAMVNMNMNLLVEELREMSKRKTVDEDALNRLAEQYGGQFAVSSVPESLEEPEEEAALELPDTGIYLPGHKRHPGITHPEYRNNVYEKEYTCPHCGKIFTSWRIFRSKLVTLPETNWMHRYDGRKFYQNFEPYWYDVVTCPHCYFSAQSDYFFKSGVLFKKRYTSQLEQAAELLKLDFSAERDLDFVYAQHYLALICTQGLVLNQRRESAAQLWKNLCWMYEDIGDGELETKAAAQAAQALLELLELQGWGASQHNTMFLEIAAMYWKGGNAPRAREWAMRMNELSPFGRNSDLARQLVGDIRESFSAKT